jgi:hypothetical protein
MNGASSTMKTLRAAALDSMPPLSAVAPRFAIGAC